MADADVAFGAGDGDAAVGGGVCAPSAAGALHNRRDPALIKTSAAWMISRTAYSLRHPPLRRPVRDFFGAALCYTVQVERAGRSRVSQET